MLSGLDYEKFYDFDIEKIFISSYLPASERIDNSTTYLSLFGKEKSFLDGDGVYHVERVWKKESLPLNDLAKHIQVDNERTHYSSVLEGLQDAINGCDHLIVTGTMRNLATVFLKVILDIVQEKNIKCTVLYCSPSECVFPYLINENQVNYFTNIVKQYPQTSFIHIDFKHYNFMKLDNFKTAKRITAPLVYELTSLLVDMAKSYKIADSVIYNPEKITSLESYYDALIEVYRSITGDIETEDNLVLKRNFQKTVEAIRLLNSKNTTRNFRPNSDDRR